ncbi:MAG TPA: metallophosphoesterase [Planctomycetaceae bacterium]|nr:metallophosphoesterase [Planctomycetaceae bacterium]
MKRALISDIHANLDALTVVLADIDAQNVDEVYCLGDIVGYGPNPRECLDRVIDRCRVTILGNHDQAVLVDPDGFNPLALRAVYWTRDQLESSLDHRSADRWWDFLGELPRLRQEDSYLFVHGSPRDPTNEYVFPEDCHNARKMEALFGRIERYCFQGHTHIPGVFLESGEFLEPPEFDFEFPLGDEKVMINVGSVGQPRDLDARACYVVLVDEPGERKAIFRRVEYPVETTVQKIHDIADLDNVLGDRLRTGR